MSPGSITMLFNKKEKALTMVGAFFVVPNTVPVLDRKPCRLYSGILQISVCNNINPYLLLRKTPSKGVNILRIRKSCFKLKNEIKNLQGFTRKTGSLKTTSIRQNINPGSEQPVWW